MATLPPLANLEDLAERLGQRLTDTDGEPTTDGARALAAIDDASALIRSEAGTDFLDDHGDLDEDLPDIIGTITLAVAARAFRNPDGATQATVGDVSVSYAREGAAGAVFLTKAERLAVRKAAGKASYGSIGMETPYGVAPASLYYTAVEGGGDEVPLGPLPWEV